MDSMETTGTPMHNPGWRTRVRRGEQGVGGTWRMFTDCRHGEQGFELHESLQKTVLERREKGDVQRIVAETPHGVKHRFVHLPRLHHLGEGRLVERVGYAPQDVALIVSRSVVFVVFDNETRELRTRIVV
jgi:hypothetical protein